MMKRHRFEKRCRLFKKRFQSRYGGILTGIICSGILLGVGVGYVYARPWTSVTNHIQTDIVDISLKEYQQQITDHGTVLLPWKDDMVILPGDRISLIPKIMNTGTDCYVRVRLQCDGNLTDADLLPYGMDDNWFLADDGFFYYTKVLHQNTNAEIFSGLSVSDSLNQDTAGKQGQLNLSVDAIQSRNFSPDYQSEHPWGEVAILSQQKSEASMVRVLQEKKTNQFQLVWQGKAEKLFVNASDFFSGFQKLLPGDVVTDAVSVQNRESKPVNIYFRSEATEGGHDLAQEIGLKIEMQIQNEKYTLYEGNLFAKELAGEQSLGTIPANAEGTLTYTLSVPSTLDNEWALSADQIRWYFSTEPVHIVQDANTHTSNTGVVKTGDMLPVVSLALAVVSFIVCIILLPYRERRSRS